jgi:hypothetical protein
LGFIWVKTKGERRKERDERTEREREKERNKIKYERKHRVYLDLIALTYIRQTLQILKLLIV